MLIKIKLMASMSSIKNLPKRFIKIMSLFLKMELKILFALNMILTKEKMSQDAIFLEASLEK